MIPQVRKNSSFVSSPLNSRKDGPGTTYPPNRCRHSPTAFAKTSQTFSGNYVPACHHHRRILIRCLFFADRACENAVKAQMRRKRYLDLTLLRMKRRERAYQ